MAHRDLLYATNDTPEGFVDDDVVWQRNVGDGDFAAPQPIGEAPNAVEAIRTADVDGDGDLDRDHCVYG